MKYISLLILIGAMIFGYWYWREHGFDFTPRSHTSGGALSDMTALPNEAQRLVDTHEMSYGAVIVTDERTFLENMISHHEEAIETANVVLARGGTTPEIKSLAESIVVTQTAEVADMKRWYKDWYFETYKASGSQHGMMPDLSSLSGVALDKAFLEGMISHHEGAIAMAKSIKPYVTQQDILLMANAIITVQAEEIAQMKSMLAAL